MPQPKTRSPLAREFDAHLVAIAFAYEAAPIAMAAGDISPELIDEIYKEAERLAKGAVTKFGKEFAALAFRQMCVGCLRALQGRESCSDRAHAASRILVSLVQKFP
jgi:hypothetical protein